MMGVITDQEVPLKGQFPGESVKIQTQLEFITVGAKLRPFNEKERFPSREVIVGEIENLDRIWIGVYKTFLPFLELDFSSPSSTSLFLSEDLFFFLTLGDQILAKKCST